MGFYFTHHKHIFVLLSGEGAEPFCWRMKQTEVYKNNEGQSPSAQKPERYTWDANCRLSHSVSPGKLHLRKLVDFKTCSCTCRSPMLAGREALAAPSGDPALCVQAATCLYPVAGRSGYCC